VIQPPPPQGSPKIAQLYSGRILIQSANESQTGDIELLLQKDGVRLRVLAPVIGSRIWELRANDSMISMYDYRDQTSKLHLNSPKIRERFLGVDVNLGELRDLLQKPTAVSRFEVVKKDGEQRALGLVKRDAVLGDLLTIDINRWEESEVGFFPQKIKLEEPSTGNKIIFHFRTLQEVIGEPIVFDASQTQTPSS
jgi:outer membrane biogenesis lipoprotein LolB